MPMRRYVCCFLSLFGLALFRACDLLVVQPDAWEFYAGCATSSCLFVRRAGRQPSLRDATRQGPRCGIFAALTHQAKPFYRFIRLPEFESARRPV